MSKLTHSTSGITASVAVKELVKGTKESLDCSGRGLCDTDDRICTCEPEFETSNGYNEEVKCGETQKYTKCTMAFFLGGRDFSPFEYHTSSAISLDPGFVERSLATACYSFF